MCGGDSDETQMAQSPAHRQHPQPRRIVLRLYLMMGHVCGNLSSKLIQQEEELPGDCK